MNSALTMFVCKYIKEAVDGAVIYPPTPLLFLSGGVLEDDL